jgi:hypothetical protein
MLCLSYYFLCLLFNKIGEKDRTGSAWKQGGGEEKEKVEDRRRNDPNDVCTYEYMNKDKKVSSLTKLPISNTKTQIH